MVGGSGAYACVRLMLAVIPHPRAYPVCDVGYHLSVRVNTPTRRLTIEGSYEL